MILFHIVPKNNGYYYLCKNINGEFVLQHKAEEPGDDIIKLDFENEAEAQKFIDNVLHSDNYKIEPFYLNEDILR